MSVEVERKFVCRSDTETRLKQLGAQFVGERSFQDRYFDTGKFTLTLSDTWLRCRGACWELKCPVRAREGEEEEEGRERGGGQRKIKLCTRYREITELSQIVDRVRQVVLRERSGEGEREKEKEIEKEGGKEGEHSCKTEAEFEGQRERREEREKEGEREGQWERETDSAWLGEFALVQFASFTTVRRSYSLPGGVRADLDLVDFGFAVGELEVLVENPEQIPAAAEKIEELVEKLGLSEACKNRVPGKMDAYLKQFHPEHYGRLLSAHKLHP
ncbi:thiamine-triphosphatase [Polyodon spathula]|uniref:thiamine-triphosphatase n=1 Tax=Polyodon spathula TaxID=7913 RepID=UPI001B7F5A2F|nr:thiamine-triphosphatase [Polyodon spathula]XP_041092645.1 thiamine-triphosphatase [Polyodon spathula]